MKASSFVLGAAFLFGIIHFSLAIKCYICNSRDPTMDGAKDIDYGPECVDPFNVTATQVPLVECNTTRNVTTNPLTNYTDELPNVCVKIITYGSRVTENRKSERVSELTSRFCGYTDGKPRCTGKDGASSYTKRCYCDEDGCNSGSSLTASVVGTAVLALAATIFLCQGK